MDIDELIQKIQEVAAENPYTIYHAEGHCFNYERNGKPDCLIGHALHRAGVSVEDLARFDKTYSGITSLLQGEYGATYDKRLGWLYNVQQDQDQGKTWATAVANADRCVALSV